MLVSELISELTTFGLKFSRPNVLALLTNPLWPYASRIRVLILKGSVMPVAVQSPTPAVGIKSYYQAKIEAAELLINQKTQNLRRLEAQRNALNARGECSHISRV